LEHVPIVVGFDDDEVRGLNRLGQPSIGLAQVNKNRGSRLSIIKEEPDRLGGIVRDRNGRDLDPVNARRLSHRARLPVQLCLAAHRCYGARSGDHGAVVMTKQLG
jgi:hypothetical protein